MAKLTSRKLWLAIAGVLAIIVSALAGQVAWSDALHQLLILVLGYLGVQGAIDLSTAVKAPPAPATITLGDHPTVLDQVVQVVGDAPTPRDLPNDPRKWQFPKDLPAILRIFRG
ncbi:MAG: hypothetical protein ACYC7E_04780 [Armatimonadota bacterium]